MNQEWGTASLYAEFCNVTRWVFGSEESDFGTTRDNACDPVTDRDPPPCTAIVVEHVDESGHSPSRWMC